MKNVMQKLAILMAGAIFISSAFLGCSKQGKSSDSAKNSTAPSTNKVDDKKPTLKYLSTWMSDDYNTYPVAKYLEEKTGYHVEYEMLPQDKPEDKLNLIIASGEPYDIVSIYGTTQMKALYSDYAKRGALTELDPLINKFGENIKNSIPAETFNTVKVDGKIYSIPNMAPNVNPVGNSFVGIMIRQDWLEKVNLKMPKTLDEFTEVLKAFKEKDPGGNGNKNIALTTGGDGSIQGIQGAFGIYNKWNEVNGKLTPMVLDPGFKDYLLYVANLYKQELLDKEFPTNKETTVREKFTSGKAGAVVSNVVTQYATLVDALKKNLPAANPAVMVPPVGKDGKQGLSSQSGLDRIVFVPKASKNQEHVIKYINAKLDKETFKVTVIGEEGKHHTVKDDQYSPILPIFFEVRGSAYNFITGSDEKNYNKYWAARLKKDPRVFEAYEVLNLKDSINIPKKDQLALAPYLPEFSKTQQQLEQMVSDYMVKVIVGSESIGTLDAFIQKWKAAGGDAVYKEVNDWYATTKK